MRPGVRQEVLPSHEVLLADYAERLARHLPGRRAVHIHLSKLRPFNRRDHHIRIAANECEALAKRFEGQIFQLSNSDIVVVVRGATVHEIDQSVLKLRYLFSDDPLAAGEDGNEHEFCTWYDLEQQYPQFRLLAKRMLEAGEQRKAQAQAQAAASRDAVQEDVPKQPLDPALLARLEQNLGGMDLGPFIRRQPVCALVPGMKPKPVFNELYVSIAELRRKLVPDVDIASDRWLFQHLTQCLDLRILAMLPALEGALPLSTSVNVNISTILSPQFLTFDTRLRNATNKTMIFELQSIDIFGDIGAYIFARDFVRDRGYRICLDGLNHLTFPLFDRNHLEFDLLKIIWSPDIEQEVQPERRQRFAAAVRDAGAARVVLCRCDSARAIEFGQSLGITVFQGRYVDGLMASLAADGSR